MYFERDTILRLIQMMGDFYRRVAELMDDISRMHLLDDECRRLCGMPLENAETLSPDSLIELLPPSPRLLACELLDIKRRTVRLGMEEEQALALKCTLLYASLRRESAVCEERSARLAQLKAMCLDGLTAVQLMDCARFFREGESYAEMEDAIYQSIERASASELGELIARGLGLLDDALEATEEALALCGMSRAEVRESQQTLQMLAQFQMMEGRTGP